MHYRTFGNRIVLRLERGEEVLESIARCCRDNGITLGVIQGLGATNDAEIGLFSVESREYHSTRITGDHEITALTGNISTKDGEIYLHVHANLGDAEHRVLGGHLNRAVVSATCEIIIERIDGNVERRFDPEVGLNLLDL